MRRFLLLLALLVPCAAWAQSDPLNSAYLPSINRTCPNTTANGTGHNIWVTDTMQKILQANSTPGTNCFMQINATQGEFADFQVHTVVPGGGYSTYSVTTSSFVCSTGPTCGSNPSIPAPSTSNNNVVVYREGYINITTKTSTGSAYLNATGNTPDALIPAIDPYYHQTTNAFPVNLPTANQTQSAWIDVFIPRTTPSGYYLGSVTVSNGATLATIPIIIGVWQWPASGSMPATPTLPTTTQFGYNDFCGIIIGSCNMNTADMDGAIEFMDHRWTMTDPVQTSNLTNYGNALWKGTTYTTTPILGTGATTTGVNWRNQTAVWASQQAFSTYFGSYISTKPFGSTGTFPKVTPFYYTSDEPGNGVPATNWTGICNNAFTSHGLTPPVATLVAGATSTMFTNYASVTGCTAGGQLGAAGILNSVDILVVLNTCYYNIQFTCNLGNGNTPAVGNNGATYNTWLNHTNPDGYHPVLWSYISNNGSSGVSSPGANPVNYCNYSIDAKPSANRCTEWMSQLYGFQGELYYYTTCVWETGCVSQHDPWVTQYVANTNGDGTLVYPSSWSPTSTHHVTLQNGSPLTNQLWIPSIRMKHMRDGGQDWEYMYALNAAGQSATVQAQINSWVTNMYTYEFTGTGLQAARTNLGNALHAISFPAGGTFPWSTLCAASRCTDWTNVGVLDPVTKLSEVKGGGIPHYPTGTGTIINPVNPGQPIAAYGTPENDGKVTSSSATMAVTAVTVGTNVQSLWVGTLVTLNEGTINGNYLGQTCPCVFTVTTGPDVVNTNGDWIGKDFWISHNGSPYHALISATSATGVSPQTVTFASIPRNTGNTASIPDGAAVSVRTVTASISSVTPGAAGTGAPHGSFTLSAVPTLAIGGYTFAGSGDPAIITNALNACSGTPGNGNVVQLGAGTFWLASSVFMVGVHDCVLRGTNPNLSTLAPGTVINYATGGQFGGFPCGLCIGDQATPSGVGAFPNTGAAYLPGAANDATWTGASLTSTVTPGTYTPNSIWITLSNIGTAGGGLHMGQIVNLDVEDGFLTVQNGFEFCNREGYGNYPPSSCSQEVPFGGRSGRRRGNATVAGNAVTLNSGTAFDPSWNGATFWYFLGGTSWQQVAVGTVNSSSSLTLQTDTTAAVPPTNPCSNSSNTGAARWGDTYLDSSAGILYGCSASLPFSWLSLSNGTFNYFIGYRGQTQSETIVGGPACLTSTGCSGAGSITVQVSDPLVGKNWSSSLIPAAWFPTGHPPVTNLTGYNAGIEDLTIDADFFLNPSSGSTISNFSVNNFWIKGVRTLHGDRSHISIYNTNHVSLENNYHYATQGNKSQSYGLEQGVTAQVLFQNNICNSLNACVATSSGNVDTAYLYNFGMDDPVSIIGQNFVVTQTSLSGGFATYQYTGGDLSAHNTSIISLAGTKNPNAPAGTFDLDNVFMASSTSSSFTVSAANLRCAPSCPGSASAFTETNTQGYQSNNVMSGANVQHGDGNRYHLIEGNIGNQFFTDTVHNASRTQTVFRNYFGGYEKNKLQQLESFRVDSLQRYHNYIGNVLGSSIIDGYENYNGCVGCTGTHFIYSWKVGPTTEGINTIDPETLGRSTSMRWGNYDTITGATRFCGPGAPGFSGAPCNSVSEVPTTDTFGYANTVPASTTLPVSFYFSTAPVWLNTQFGVVPFPPIGPDVTGGNAMSPDMLYTRTPPGGHAYDNAASKVWQNAPIDPNYVGFDGGVRLFSETMYTPGGVLPLASLTPNPLAFGNQNINTTSAVQNATLSNVSSVTLNIISIVVAGNFTRVGGTCGSTLAALTSCTIGVTFTPNITGPFSGSLTVNSNATGSPNIITLTGTGTVPVIQWAPTSVNFGNVVIGQVINSSPIVLTNTGTGPLNVFLTFTGANPAQFSPLFSNTCGAVLAAGASCQVVVRFTPIAVQSYSANLVETDAVQSISGTVTLSGAGITQPVTPSAPLPVIILGGSR